MNAVPNIAYLTIQGFQNNLKLFNPKTIIYSLHDNITLLPTPPFKHLEQTARAIKVI